ncbi:MAG: hypothetical protein ACKVVP_10730 [Chloroflexota bacterium]
MTARIEWRTKGKGDDALVFVREFGEAGDTVLKTWSADPELIADFLNDMDRLDSADVRLESAVDQRAPYQWGELVLSRAQQGGDVLAIDPEHYWDGIYYWFRSRGLDPHPWRPRHK